MLTRGRCDLCPVAFNLVCPANRTPPAHSHTVYCDQLAADPETYSPLIVAAARREAGLEPPPPPRPKRTDDALQALLRGLSPEGRETVESCGWRGSRQACCGPVTVCRLGRYGHLRITIIDCARCVQDGGGDAGARWLRDNLPPAIVQLHGPAQAGAV